MKNPGKIILYAGADTGIRDLLDFVACDLPVRIITDSPETLCRRIAEDSPDAVILDSRSLDEERLIGIFDDLRKSEKTPEIGIVGTPGKPVPEKVRIGATIIFDDTDVRTPILGYILSLLDLSNVKRQMIILGRTISRDGDTSVFRMIAEHMDDIVCLLDACDKKIVFINSAVSTHTGYSVRECLSPSYSDISKSPAGIILSDFASKCGHPGTSKLFEFITEIPRRNTKTAHLHVAGFFFTSGDSGKTLIAAMARNACDEPSAARVPKPDTVRALFSYSPVATFIFDGKKILYANNAAIALIGAILPDELIGKPATSLLRDSDHAEYLLIYEEILSEEKFRHLHDAILIRADGTEIHTDIITTKISYNGRDCVAVYANEHSSGTDMNQQEERLFISAVEHAPDAVLLLTGDTITYLNRSARTLFKAKSKKEIIGRPVFDFISSGDIQRTKTRFREFLDAGKRPPKEEFTYIAVDGSLIHIEVNSLPFTYGNRPATLAFLEDISQRKKAEEALIRSASHIEAIYRSTPNAIVLVSSGVICEANNQIFEMTGYAPYEIIGAAFRNIFPSESEFQRVKNMLMRSSGSESSEHFEASLRKKDGSIFPVLMRGTHFPQADNDCTYIFSALDITARKTTEKMLARSKEELKIIYENSPFIIILLDSGFKLRRANKAALDFAHLNEFHTELRLEDIIRCDKHLRGICDDNNPACAMRKILDDTLLNGAIFNKEEVSIENASGDSLIHSSMLVSSCRTEVSGERMILLCIEDITEKKRLNETIRQMQKLETIGRLAGGIAHDFNNILSALSLHISYLKEDRSLPEAVRNDFRMIESNIQRGTNLTRKLLLFGRRESMKFSPVEVNTLINDLVKILSRILGGNISIDFVPSDRELKVLADAGMIELAIINLCVNARDAMPDGGTIVISPGLSVTRNPETPAGVADSFVRICLEDNGVGLSDDARSRLFDPFFTTKQSDIGTGLGLSVVYGIIKNHHGWISTASESGKGTRFELFIPEHTR